MRRLRQCTKNPNHWYSGHSSGCPWCWMVRVNFSDPFSPPGNNHSSPEPPEDGERIPIKEQPGDQTDHLAPVHPPKKGSTGRGIAIAGICGIIGVLILTLILLSAGSTSSPGTDDGTTYRITWTATPVPETTKSGGTGEVTISGEGDLSYYLGERIPFYGSNTATDTTYLFITGPGLPVNGAQIENPEYGISDGDVTTFATAKVNSDGTWSWIWNTGTVPLDAGAYTVYAASYPDDRNHLSGIRYGTVVIALKRPFISAMIEDSVLDPGEATEITGSALGNPPQVQVWTLGSEYADLAMVAVGPDGSFRHTISGDTTEKMKSGMYFIIVQHPMENARFDIVRGDNPHLAVNLVTGTSTEIFSKDAIAAAEGLAQAINDSSVDDTYTKLQFLVE